MHFWGRGRFFLIVVAAFFLFTACSGNATPATFVSSFTSISSATSTPRNSPGANFAAQPPATGIVQMYREIPEPAQPVKREVPLPSRSGHTETVNSKSADFAGTDAEPGRDFASKSSVPGRDFASMGSEAGRDFASQGSEAVDCSEEKCVALTFDDGPAPTTTPKLLDILAREEVPATFFVLGSQVEKYPEIVKRAALEGHEIGNHTWKHDRLTSLPSKAARKDLDKTNRMIEKASGTAPTLLRPPYGSTNKKVAKVAKQSGLAVILWDVDSRDWEHRDPKKTVKEANAAQDGSIILLHDIHASTIGAVPNVIKALRKQGFSFVTVSDLVAGAKPGESHFRAHR